MTTLGRAVLAGACVVLAGCAVLGDGAGSAADVTAGPPTSGPGADYPVLVGDPYKVNGVTYTPVDTLNYDAVGYVAQEIGVMGYTGAHHTLPVPSYVEVTSLETGRTILVRLERRGPMDANNLLALSPAAMAQLGAAPETPVRVRRVNPPEEQRAMLRAGNSAPLRMDTPMSLVNVLKRKLPAATVEQTETLATPEPIERIDLEPSQAEQAQMPEIAAATDVPDPGALPALDAEVAAAAEPVPEPAPAPEPAPEAEGGFVVQAAAFSTRERAEKVAGPLGARITAAGKFFRVRTGPFTTRAEAEASLAKVRAAGYTDARILTSG